MNWLSWIVIATVIISSGCVVDYAQRHLESFVAHKHFND
jgi:hypothetical protein